MIELSKVKKGFKHGNEFINILSIESLTFQQGEQYLITGPSGSGKTTLFNLISGLALCNEGSIKVNGVELAGASEGNRDVFRAQNIGYVFQNFNLFENLTVYENIALPLTFSKGSRKNQRVNELIERVNMGFASHKKVQYLSKGEQQRVAIARCLVNNPPIILADEPTGNLDYRTGNTIIELIQGVAKDNGATLLLISHDQSLQSRFSRLIDLMEVNQVVRQELEVI